MRWLAIVAIVLVAACGRQAPAPLVMGGDTPANGVAPPLPMAKPMARTALGAGGTVTVEAGDSLYAIARRRGVSVRGLIDLNGLAPPYALQVGQTLMLPAEVVHDVVAGDTLSGVARRYEVSLRGLARANDLAEPYVITIGQRLSIPTTGAGPAPTAPAITPAPSATVAVEPIAEPTGTVVISSHGTSVETAAEPTTLGAVEDEPAPPPPAEPVAAEPPEPQAPPAATPPAASVVNAAVPAASVVNAAVPEPAPRAGKLFAWPVRGKVVSTFGAKAEGLSNDGINIAAALGTPVLAAENGVVVYAGNEIPGFGNLILIRHADGWVTAYAHNGTISVGKNDRVKRGQPIATVGATGNVASPQTHFEIRKGNDPVDPLKFLADE